MKAGRVEDPDAAVAQRDDLAGRKQRGAGGGTACAVAAVRERSGRARKGAKEPVVAEAADAGVGIDEVEDALGVEGEVDDGRRGRVAAPASLPR